MRRALITLAVLTATVADAQAPPNEPMPQADLLAAFGWNFDTAEVTTEKVGEGLYVLFGLGGNIAASVGEQGVLIVDDMFPQMVPKVLEAIAGVGGKGVDFAINTHWHFDHADGNLALGPAGARIVAHANSAAMMASDNLLNMVRYRYKQEAYPPAARPVIVFDDRLRFHFNDDEIDVVHVGPAHTAGDAAVIFRNHNAVHFGDVFNNAGYPYIDVDNGGHIDGVIAFCQAILDEIGPKGVVIPGHGPVTDGEALAAYIDMLKTVRARVAKLIEEGKGLMDAVASRPTEDFDAKYGSEMMSLGFVDRVYTSLRNADAR